ncbi:MAG: DUF2227 family putative metal-binding protein [Candidatus Bipolaricaulaceae bacterium]
MPTGRTHLAVELVTLPLWGAAGAAAGVGETPLAVFAASYAGASLLLSPDLDLPASDSGRRWGPARILWFPYTAACRHRGVSHSLLLGPLTRLVYLGALISLGWWTLHLGAGVPPPRPIPAGLLLPILAGIYVPHLLHVGLDRTASLWGRARLRLRRL